MSEALNIDPLKCFDIESLGLPKDFIQTNKATDEVLENGFFLTMMKQEVKDYARSFNYVEKIAVDDSSKESLELYGPNILAYRKLKREHGLITDRSQSLRINRTEAP